MHINIKKRGNFIVKTSCNQLIIKQFLFPEYPRFFYVISADVYKGIIFQPHNNRTEASNQKSQISENYLFAIFICGDKGNRTPDLLTASQTL